MTIKVLVVPVEGEAEVREINPDLESLQAIVGGYLEAVQLSSCHLYCDEEGKLKAKPINRKATVLARTLGWPRSRDVLVGDVVFLADDGSGDEADVPAIVLEVWRKLEVAIAAQHSETPDERS